MWIPCPTFMKFEKLFDSLSTHLQHRWACLCAPAADGLSVPSEWVCSGNRPQRDTDTQAPWTHIHSILDKPARNRPDGTDEPPHASNLNWRSVSPEHNFSFCPTVVQKVTLTTDTTSRDAPVEATLSCIRQRTGQRFIRTQQPVEGRFNPHSGLTSSESPDITSAQSCFLLKALSSRWASPRVVTYDININAYKENLKIRKLKITICLASYSNIISPPAL